MRKTRLLALSLSMLAASVSTGALAQQRPLDVTDIMKFREIKQTTVAENGQFIAFSAVPDRGDASGYLINNQTDQTFTFEQATAPSFSANGTRVAFVVKPALLALESADKAGKKKLKNGLLVVSTADGSSRNFERVKSYALSDDGNWAAIQYFADDEKSKAKEDKSDKAGESEQTQGKEIKLHNSKNLGLPWQLVQLNGDKVIDLPDIEHFSFSPSSDYLVYSVSGKNGDDNGLFVHNLTSGNTTALQQQAYFSYSDFAWTEDGEYLALISGSYESPKRERTHNLLLWRTGKTSVSRVDYAQDGWFIPADQALSWSEDGKRLFFNTRPAMPEQAKTDTKVAVEADLYDTDKITAKRGLHVWHDDDPVIKTNEIKRYKDEVKRGYLAVYHRRGNDVVQLADLVSRNAKASDNDNAMLATDDQPYLKQRTWDGFYADLYHVDMQDGEKTLITTKLANATSAILSESGRYVSYYQDGHIWTYDVKRDRRTNHTEKLNVSFANELHDYPSDAPGYGFAGWLEDDEGFIAYDRYDIWLFKPGRDAVNLTKVGREQDTVFRVIKTDDELDHYNNEQTLLLSSYHDVLKYHGFYQLDLDNGALSEVLTSNNKYKFVAKAQDADTLFYTRESFTEFPDLWRTDLQFNTPKKITDINPQIGEFKWGQPELVNWTSTLGKPLQGVLIKPADYQPGQQYPVLVYYYRYFSQRMYEFNQMKVNHRPNFPYYTSNGYAVFLPDVKFDVGTPGASATQALVPGVQKIIEMGVADPDAIGLHGHSWSGYQTAFAITQTDVFKAAVAGAPVTNMTSAYSGIRIGSGLARQFQYEKGQSRIGASMFERRDLYIENSPVFFADRINTPLLIQFGDVDGAVPWQQGIEMYLAMRRLDKDVIMLQYEDEPHHLKKYPNKVDYTLKMKAFFDYHLKGEAPEAWITEGVPYFKAEK